MISRAFNRLNSSQLRYFGAKVKKPELKVAPIISKSMLDEIQMTFIKD